MKRSRSPRRERASLLPPFAGEGVARTATDEGLYAAADWVDGRFAAADPPSSARLRRAPSPAKGGRRAACRQFLGVLHPVLPSGTSLDPKQTGRILRPFSEVLCCGVWV